MTSIGIIANPASGKDIRRIVSHATTIDNNEKANIVERIILGAQAHGIENIYIMPDFYNFGYRVEDRLRAYGKLGCSINIINVSRLGGMEDTINAVKLMEEIGVGCIVTLGGDGTNRAVAKVINNTPLIAISTGTNNVYPVMMEGTMAGIAAAVVASKRFDSSMFITRDKRIEIFKNNNLIDIALVDAVISRETSLGTKAIWEINNIEKIFVTRSHPASIGFSSIMGSKKVVLPQDDFGAYININGSETSIKATVAAGVVEKVSVDEPVKLIIGEEYEYITKFRGTIALDGEKEIEFINNECYVFKITRNGPNRVNVAKALEIALLNGFFEAM